MNKYTLVSSICIIAMFGVIFIGISQAGANLLNLEPESVIDSRYVETDSDANGGKYANFDHSIDNNPDSIPIPYEGSGQYDASLITYDEVVSTRVYGINQSKGQQLFTVDCLHSHRLPDDPIVYPGQEGRAHLHEFFGIKTVNANSTVESIISEEANSCVVSPDRSSYWSPVAYEGNKIVDADNNKFYYKVGDVNPTTIQPMPLGLRMVAGDALATSGQSLRISYLFATTGEGKTTEPKTQTTKSGSTNMFTVKAGENGVRALIKFPQCWDGEYLWLPGTAHMAYPDGSKCPDTHPVPLLQLQFNLGYSDANGGSDFRFSSGGWFTGHGDFVNGWNPELFEQMVSSCLRTKTYCGLSQSGVQCNSYGSVRRGELGCWEFRKGQNPRYVGNPDYKSNPRGPQEL